MRNILIVEDDKIQKKNLISIAEEVNSNVRIFNTDLIENAYNIATMQTIGAFFVDIQLPDGNGIDFAKKIRLLEKYQFTPIIFITGVPTKEMEAFHDIHSYDYILKPYSKETVEKVMRKILVDYFDQKFDKDKFLSFDFKGVKQRINTKDIVLIERKNRRIFIRTQYEEIKYKHMNLTHFLKELPDNFFQIHQSIIINADYIKKIDKINSQLYMNAIDDLIPVGTSYKKKVGEIINGIL